MIRSDLPVANPGYWVSYKNSIVSADCSIKSIAAKASCVAFPVFVVLAIVFNAIDSCATRQRSYVPNQLNLGYVQLQALKRKCQETLPRFNALIELYQSGGEISFKDYQEAYLHIMRNELGFSEEEVLGGVDFEGDRIPEPFDSLQLYMKIREKLGLEAELLTGFDNVGELEPYAFLVRGNGHTNVALLQSDGSYMIPPEYPEANQPMTPALYRSKEELQTNENVPIYAPGFPIKNGYCEGRVPNMNSCAMEACIALFAAFIPAS